MYPILCVLFVFIVSWVISPGSQFYFRYSGLLHLNKCNTITVRYILQLEDARLVLEINQGKAFSKFIMQKLIMHVASVNHFVLLFPHRAFSNLLFWERID